MPSVFHATARPPGTRHPLARAVIHALASSPTTAPTSMNGPNGHALAVDDPQQRQHPAEEPADEEAGVHADQELGRPR